MRSWLCRRGQTFTASGELAGDLMGTRSVASSYAAIVVLFYAGLMVGDRRSRTAQSCICILIQHADWLRVLVSRSCPRGNCSGWAAPASPAFFGLLLASVILHEKVGWALVAVNIAVIMCVAAARRFAK